MEEINNPPALTGSQILDYRTRALLAGLEMETKGMMRSRGRSCYAIIKTEYGFKGSKVRVLEQFQDYLNGEG